MKQIEEYMAALKTSQTNSDGSITLSADQQSHLMRLFRRAITQSKSAAYLDGLMRQNTKNAS